LLLPSRQKENRLNPSVSGKKNTRKSRSRKGIDTAALKKKAGFKGRTVENIIYRLKKQGKIKRDRKGI
jgi:hypothetical protein